MLGFRLGNRARALGAFVILAALPACGGGGGGGSVPTGGGPTPSPTPLPVSSTAVVPVSAAGPVSGPFGPISGSSGPLTGSISIPAASNAATLTVTETTAQPGGTPAVNSMRRRPASIGTTPLAGIVYVTVTSNASVAFAAFPSVTIILPASVPFAYVAEYDPTNAAAGWNTIEGPASGSTLNLTGAATSLQLTAGTTYSFVVFTVASALPTPPPCPALTSFAVQAGTNGGGHGGGGSGTSTYDLTSLPSALCVRRIDPSGASAPASLTTEALDTPPTAAHQWYYAFPSRSGSGMAPFAVAVDQVQDGPHAVFYNQAGDSAGSVDSTQLQSAARAARSVRGAGTTARRFAAIGHPAVDPAHLYVRYRAGVLQQTGRRVADIERALGTDGVSLPSAAADTVRAVRVPAGTPADAFAAQLRARSDVAEVARVHYRVPLTKPPAAATDPHFVKPDQWYLFADGFPNAWSYTTGATIKIAVVDTGIDHFNTDLSAKLVFAETVNGGNGAVIKAANAQDANGHGTNVAGIAAAQANNALGFAGAGYDVKLMAFDIFPDANASSHTQFASTVDEAKAIKDAVDNGADVVSLSIGSGQGVSGSDGYDAAEAGAIAYALANKVVVVAAAGNNADGGEGFPANSNLDYPAAYNGVISVGASALRESAAGDYATASEYVTSYSQFGPSLSVVAPGGDPSSSDSDPLHWIWNYSTTTAGYGPDQCTYEHGALPVTPTNCTAFFAGTSQATPQVSAAAALIIAASGGHGSITPARVLQIITGTADNINDPHQGHGRLNAYRALASVTGDTAAYSGPQPTKTSVTQAIAFAYATGGSNKPAILNYDFPLGVPIASDGTFRIADVRPADAASYRVGVWYDANGNGIIDAGDTAGVSATVCSASSPCAIARITLAPVTGAYTLP